MDNSANILFRVLFGLSISAQAYFIVWNIGYVIYILKLDTAIQDKVIYPSYLFTCIIFSYSF
jgi:uncharacterized membrane-anchored protein